MPFSIVELRERPEFATLVAERIWRAWWKNSGMPREYIEGRLRENFESSGIPVCFVACNGDRFLGTSSVIESDCSARPLYAPWVAAAWVEPDERGQGVGGALVHHSAVAALKLGRRPIDLCAEADKREFYRRLRWTAIK